MTGTRHRPATLLASFCAGLALLAWSTGGDAGGPQASDLLSPPALDKIRAATASVNVVLIYPVGQYCEGVCWDEAKELATAMAELPPGATRLFVAFSGVPGGVADEALRRRMENLPASAIAVIDGDARPSAALATRIRLAPVKLVLDRSLEILAMDSCAELPQERAAFRALVMKAVRHLHDPPRTSVPGPGRAER